MAVKPTRRYVRNDGSRYWAFDGTLKYMGSLIGAINGRDSAEECFDLLCAMRDARIRDGIDAPTSPDPC